MPRPRSLATLAAIKELSQPEQFPRVVPGVSPAVATDVTLVCPGDTIWLVRSLRLRLVADANVANRIVTIAADDGTTEFWRTSLSANITNGQTAIISLAQGIGPPQQFGTVWTAPLPTPALILPPGFRLRTVTTALQVGDQYSQIGLYVTDVAASPQDVDLQRELLQLGGRLPYATAEESEGF